MKVTKYAVINDLHIPFEDKKAVATVLDIIEDAECTHIILNGDMCDMYNVNSHGPAHPMVGTLLEDEITATRFFLERLRARFKKQKIIFLFGNHEDRMERFIIKNCRKLFKLLSLDKLLTLDDLKIEWYHYNHRYRIEETNTFVQHSPPSYAKTGAMTSLEKDIDESSIYGCSHRELKATKTGKSGKKYFCFFNGWLGSTTATPAHKKVFSYVKGHESWQHCFCIVTCINGKETFIEQISVNNGKAVYDGHLYGA